MRAVAPRTRIASAQRHAAPDSATFHHADKETYRRVAVVGVLLFCAAFVVISFSLRPQADDGRMFVKADRLVRTARQAPQAR